MSDATKPRVDLVPMVGLERVARVLEAGLKDGKVSNDWQRVPREQFAAALYRHVVRLQHGDSKEDHLAAVATNALILMWFDAAGNEPTEGAVVAWICSSCSTENGPNDKGCSHCGAPR